MQAPAAKRRRVQHSGTGLEISGGGKARIAQGYSRLSAAMAGAPQTKPIGHYGSPLLKR